MRISPVLKFGLLVAIATLLSVTTFVLGAAPMRAIRLIYGRLPYWGGFALISAGLAAGGLPAYALLLFALVVVVGVYTDIEEHGGSVFVSGFVGTITALGTTAFCGGLWLFRAKIHLLEEIRKMLSAFETGIDTGVLLSNQAFTINPEAFIQQLPSIAVIALIIALGVALISESRVLQWFGLPQRTPPRESAPSASQLSAFRNPDAFIWLTIAAVFGTFFHHGNAHAETVSVNALNVLAVVFFFQGLTIVAHMFKTFKVSPFWRGLWYIILVLQLFFLVSLIGFADFWVEFRERLARKPAATNKSF